MGRLTQFACPTIRAQVRGTSGPIGSSYLQSPRGAERTPIATDDREQLLKLNERLLPWAVLFGREKAWTAELGRFYEENGTQPGW